MKKIVVYGQADNIFAKVLLEKARAPEEETLVEIIETWNDLTKKWSELNSDTLVLINKSESEALNIKEQRPSLQVIMCHGGGEKSKPTLTWIDAQKNHQYFLFENLTDFWEKIKNPPLDFKPLLSALPETDTYLVNYQNFPELEKRQKNLTNQKFFWFSIYFSRIYLWWFAKWLEEISKKMFPFTTKLGGRKNIKRLTINFSNRYRGEIIFREGEKIEFRSGRKKRGEALVISEDEANNWVTHGEISNLDDETDFEDVSQEDGKKEKTPRGTIISADEEGLEIQFNPAISRDLLEQQRFFKKSDNLLALTTEAYSKSCAGYSDLSLKDYIYSQKNHYYKPEDFLRGYLPNLNQLHLPIPTVKLDGRSKLILQDRAQLKALMDIIGPSFLTTVEGPPGTGKTLLAAVAIKQFLLQNKIIFVTAHSNKGLDNILEALAEHIDPKKIFRLGNDPSLIISAKASSWHRSKRYKKQVLKDKKKYEAEELQKTTGSSTNKKAEKKFKAFDTNAREIYYENEAIWKLICEGQGFVLASTVNSFQFDRSLSNLFSTNALIAKQDFTDTEGLKNYEDNYSSASASLFSLPKTVIEFMAGDNKKIKPQFIVDVIFNDEATKGRLFELIPLFKVADSKLVLFGDTDQLGNIKIVPDTREEMMAKVLRNLYPIGLVKNQMRLYSALEDEEEHSLPPLDTTVKEVRHWFDSFAQGMFYSLINDSHIDSNKLDVNRRSLPEITELINYVFKKNLRFGRFNPYVQGRTIFLDVVGTEKRIKTSFKNATEASIISREVINFFKRQKKAKGKINLSSLGIIATYRGQVKTIKEDLRNDLLFHPIFSGLITPENIDETLKSMVNTVDAFQGSERDVIIASLVRANPDGQIGFSNDIRRLYVAWSRARNELIIVGNANTFLKSQDKIIREIFGRLIHFTQTKKTYARKDLTQKTVIA